MTTRTLQVVLSGTSAMTLTRRLAATAGLLLAVAAAASAADAPPPAIPFPDALRAAVVRIERTGNKPEIKIGSEGLVVGNGEINAIVYATGNDLMLRISKNDVWDGRIDTSEDPEIPRVDPANHKLFREKPGNPPSWNKPYPCAVPCADVKLTGSSPTTQWVTELDLASAVATASSSGDRATVRALPRANVFYIRSDRPVELLGVPQKFLPAATTGAEDGVAWLRQEIPGDDDAAGMQVFLATAADGPRRVVAVTTSVEGPEPLRRAVRLVRETLARPDESLVREHEATWTEFWSRSGVRLDEKNLQNWWYRMVYYFGCFSRAGATGVGLKASLDRQAGWHNSYKFNYNIQQAYFSAGPINHPELAEPLIDVLAAYWPRARWFARTAFTGCEGAFVHSDIFHPREPDPARCKTRNRHQFAYIPWGYSLGMQGHIAMILWESHQYQPDQGRLRDKVYPMLRDIAMFYCSFIEQCGKDDRGKYVIGPSYIPENGYFGQDNTAYDIPFIAYGLKAARDAATVLKTDDALVRRIGAVLERMPAYELIADPAQGGRTVVTYHRGAKLPNDDRHGSLVMAVFPAGQVTWFSPPDEKELFGRTIDLVGRVTTHANSPVTLNIARARLSLTDDAMSNIAIDFTRHHVEQPNGLFAWKAHGSYISEQVGVARMITELLLQSVGDVIRVFPAWPRGTDAEFAGLRAQGGFEVSARLAGGEIGGLAIRSTAGGETRLVNPWPGSRAKVTNRSTGRDIPCAEVGGMIRFVTEPGAAYFVSR